MDRILQKNATLRVAPREVAGGIDFGEERARGGANGGGLMKNIIVNYNIPTVVRVYLVIGFSKTMSFSNDLVSVSNWQFVAETH